MWQKRGSAAAKRPGGAPARVGAATLEIPDHGDAEDRIEIFDDAFKWA